MPAQVVAAAEKVVPVPVTADAVSVLARAPAVAETVASVLARTPAAVEKVVSALARVTAAAETVAPVLARAPVVAEKVAPVLAWAPAVAEKSAPVLAVLGNLALAAGTAVPVAEQLGVGEPTALAVGYLVVLQAVESAGAELVADDATGMTVVAVEPVAGIVEFAVAATGTAAEMVAVEADMAVVGAGMAAAAAAAVVQLVVGTLVPAVMLALAGPVVFPPRAVANVEMATRMAMKSHALVEPDAVAGTPAAVVLHLHRGCSVLVALPGTRMDCCRQRILSARPRWQCQHSHTPMFAARWCRLGVEQ